MSSSLLEWCNCCWPNRKEKTKNSGAERATVYLKQPEIVVTNGYLNSEAPEKVPAIIVSSPRSNYDPDEFYTARTSRSIEKMKFKSMPTLIEEIRVEILQELKELEEKESR
ncbi:unnamed protein product [Bursaphelenchus okinawaensis]|uniref:Uncharacterized protein n=1 Tax=Bursaphelenchus okinawaensis TaxID=465554 RepID=A0A811JU90_9BILA|nr:unnamed protein product [Bursaphelenchus okinawaensis]CAG9083805.1 unnamed protein product [Bursaphelenchus okinawaensis]